MAEHAVNSTSAAPHASLALARHPLVQLTLVRIREFVREPEALFWAFFFPVLLTAGLGIAFRSQPVDSVTVVTAEASLEQSLRQEPGLHVRLLQRDAAQAALRTGKAALLADRAADGSIVYRYDDTNPEGRTARMLADRAIQRAGGRRDTVSTSEELVREPGSRYVDFFVPGLVGLGIMSNALWGIGFSIVDSRRRKLMKRLVATPMPRRYYLMSYLVARILVLVVEIGVPVGFGALAFGVPVRGRLLDLVAIGLISSTAFSALALLVASRAKTIEGVSGLMNLVQVPMWIVSGVFFSAQRFPDAVQPFIAALPLTATIDAMRAHMLEGASLFQVGPQLVTLGVWVVVCFTLALKLFRWR